MLFGFSKEILYNALADTSGEPESSEPINILRFGVTILTVAPTYAPSTLESLSKSPFAVAVPPIW